MGARHSVSPAKPASSALRPAASTGSGAFDHLPFAIFVLNGTGEVKFHNDQAAALIADTGPLAIRAGRLGPRATSCAAAYARAMTHARAGVTAHVALAGERRRPLFLSIAPSQRDCTFYVTIADPEAPCAEPAEIAAMLDISMAEAHVARALFDGARIPAIAAARRVKIETVRSQLRSLYSKLDVKTQAELIRHLAALPRSARAQGKVRS